MKSHSRPSRTSAAAAATAVAGNLSIKVLGEFAVTRDGIATALPQSRETRALLAYLAVVGRPQRRERLCEIFWDVPDDPRGALRWSLSRLRQTIGDVFETAGDTVALRRGAISVDYDRVRSALATGANPGLEELEAAADLFHGGFLDDLSLPAAPISRLGALLLPQKPNSPSSASVGRSSSTWRPFSRREP